MDMDFLISEGLGFISGSTNARFKTDIHGKVKLIEKVILPKNIASSFKDNDYTTYETTEYIDLYRVYGKGYSGAGAESTGCFASTEFAESRIDAKIRLALKPAWKNTLLVEEKIAVPPGTIIQVGIVAPIVLETGTVLPGGAEQILLPRNWSEDWIVGYREITSKPLMDYPEFYPEPPIDHREKPNR